MKKQLLVLVAIALLLTGCGGSTNSGSDKVDIKYCVNPEIPSMKTVCSDLELSLMENSDLNDASDQEISDLKSFLVWMIIFLAFYILLLVIFLKWVAKTARKKKRSVAGFVWMGFFFPLLAWIILLTINETNNSI